MVWSVSARRKTWRKTAGIDMGWEWKWRVTGGAQTLLTTTWRADPWPRDQCLRLHRQARGGRRSGRGSGRGRNSWERETRKDPGHGSAGSTTWLHCLPFSPDLCKHVRPRSQPPHARVSHVPTYTQRRAEGPGRRLPEALGHGVEEFALARACNMAELLVRRCVAVSDLFQARLRAHGDSAQASKAGRATPVPCRSAREAAEAAQMCSRALCGDRTARPPRNHLDACV